MYMKVTCPTCGHKYRVAEASFGKQIPCPNCNREFQCQPGESVAEAAGAAEAVPVHATPQSRPVQIQRQGKIHYRCPCCQKSLESPAHMAGEKLNCPDCSQRLQIPQSSTIRPVEDSAPAIWPEEASPPAQELPTVIPVVTAAPRAPERRESCLECGKDVSDHARVQSCPNCGSTFCSAMCYRSHQYHAHRNR